MRTWRTASAVLALVGLLMGCSSNTTSPGGGGGGGNGRITGNASRDAAGGTVQLDGTSVTGRIAADGSFALTGCPAGEYTLSVTAPGGKGGAALVRVVDGQVTQVNDLTVAPAGQIAGIVSNSKTGQPIAGAKVLARLTPLIYAYGDATPPSVSGGVAAAGGPAVATGAKGRGRQSNTTDGTDGSVPPRVTTTDSLGSFTFTGAQEGPYSIEVSADGYESGETGTWVGAGSTAPADLRLVPVDPNNAALRGKVSGNTDGTVLPLSAVRVDLWPTSQGEYPVPVDASGVALDPSNIDPWCVPPFDKGKSATTDSQGNYSITNIEPGDYTLVVWRFGFEQSKSSLTFTAKQAAVRDVTLVNNLVSVSGTVSGRKADGTLAPLAGAWVNAYGNVYLPPELLAGKPARGKQTTTTNEPLPPGVAVTDASGHYKLECEGGHVIVSAWADGYQYAQVEAEVARPGKTGVDLTLEPWNETTDGPAPPMGGFGSGNTGSGTGTGGGGGGGGTANGGTGAARHR